ncbi:hypothetical protein MLOOGBEN_21770 [Bacillus sp. EB106-08-02-XG196]|uniref:hypothetical protein n=1 Tax=Bacillus sp. EB106-08-02-XG196 TaxID=2737049 RepID=UPI0015C4ABC0|nr:hypothetical protein [Bacillus sp. EB106-08-02-XG196]NWQ43333.1 hypothetical protein [Bacillus sp. EB106-08-02-XG196]
MLIKDAYQDSFLYEESSLAHYIHYLLTEKIISLDDDISKLDFDQANHQKVAEMIRNNELCFNKIRVYSLKVNQRDFVFIFAFSEEEAIKFYVKTFHQNPMNCHESLLDFEFYRGNEVISFRDMRREFESFPEIAGYFSREC